MTENNETTILEEGDVKITNLSAAIGTKTYAMLDITSVKVSRRAPLPCLPIMTLILSLLFILVFFLEGNIREDFFWFVGSGFGVTLSIAWLVGRKSTYSVRIESTSGESNILDSKDEAYIKRVVKAMNDVIVGRG